jgi:PAS domain S-box-containing protein
MNAERLQLLIVEDEKAHVEAIRRAFETAGADVHIRAVGTLREFRAAVADRLPDVALVDLNLPDGQAMEVLTNPPEDAPFPVLVMTAYGNQEIVVKVMKAGALDYVVKSPETFGAMPHSMENLLREWKLLQQHKQAVEALRDSEVKFRTLLKMTPLPLCHVRKDGVIIFRNERFVRVFGYTSDDVPTLAEWWMRAYPDPQYRQWVTETWDAAVRRAIAEGRDIDPVEHKVTCKSGEERTVEISGVTLGEEFLAVFIDLTARKRAEAEHEKLQTQFTQIQKMESVGRLAGGVAHDFHNMLMGIMGYAEMCRNKIAPDHPIREWLNEIILEVERSAQLTHQLLAFARKQSIAPKVLDVNAAILGMLKLLRRLIGEDVVINWRPDTDTWPVKMDPGQIDQILANLAVNARDAIGGVGSINIETSNATFDQSYCSKYPGSPPGNYVLLTVTDSGCGMTKEVLDHIFEPFFTTKGVGEGTGLGLATVYGIVKQNNGFINVYSEPGKGTSFKIYLPRFIATEVVEVAAETPTQPPHGNETVLLVEDEKSIRITTQVFLADLGYTVLVAERPEKALLLASKHPGEIHMLITDVIMPGMSGRDMAQRLLEVRPALKRLFISGFTADVIAQRGILDDGVSFLSKPFGRDALARKVREVLDGQKMA